VIDFITDSPGRSSTLETCDLPEEEFRISPFVLVIFGGAGDLAQRKLIPTIFDIFVEKELPEDFAVIGVGMPGMSDGEYRRLMAEALEQGAGIEGTAGERESFAEHLFYVPGSFDDEKTYEALRERMKGLEGTCGGKAIYYLAVPPGVTPVIVEKLRDLKLCSVGESAKVIIEKPFGRDRASAVQLNTLLRSAFEENQIYRIDHYLGKETVQNIIFFRFSNTIFERLWNSQYIDCVQITVAEDIGIEHRGAFYEEAGVVRDIVQNHLLQLVALVAMEPPVGFEADYIRDEKVKVFRSIRPMGGEEIDRYAVRGQYGPGEVKGVRLPGYREEEKVAADSGTPTFMAARLAVANWRWAGVPFYIRAGKRLPRKVTEICIQFKQPPLRLFGRTCDVLEPNILVLTIQPDERIFLRFGVKYPRAANKIYPVNVDFHYGDIFQGKTQPPYGRLLVDCMKGDLTLFVRQDGVEAMWEVVDPLIERWESEEAANFPNYGAGSWGPAGSDGLLRQDGRNWITL
jgi:glucose-6-phosphate 1-dehydrogenase